MLDEIRDVLATHPDTAGRTELSRSRTGSTPTGASGGEPQFDTHARRRRPPGAPTGWAVARHRPRRGRARSAAGSCSRIEPDAARRGRATTSTSTLVSATNGKTTTTRLLAEALRADGTDRRHEPTGREHARRGSRRRWPRAPGPGVAVLEVDERCAAAGRRPAARRAARARQPHPRPARPLRRGARGRRARGATCARRTPTSRSSRTRRTRTSCGRRRRRPRPGSRSALRGATTPRPARAAAPLLRWADRAVRLPELRVRAARDSEPARRRHARPRRRAHPAAARAARAAGTGERGARRHRRGHPLRGRRRRRGRRGSRPWRRVAGRFIERAPGRRPRRRASCSRRTPPAGPRCCAGSRTDRGSVVLAVNAHVADGQDPSWLWDVPYELLRGHPSPRRASAASTSRCASDYGGVEYLVEPDPLAAARALPATTCTSSRRTRSSPRSTGSRCGPVTTARESAVRVGLVYPELLGTYGDRGNAVVLVRAVPVARHRRPSSSRSAAGAPIPDSLDVYLFGGGEDDPQVMAAAGMRASRDAIERALARRRGRARGVRRVPAHRSPLRSGATATASTASGWSTWTTRAGSAPAHRRGRRRAGAVGTRRLAPPRTAHRLREPRRPHHARPGRRARSAGSSPAAATASARRRRRRWARARLVGTYLHGPVLPRNPALADLLLGWVCGPTRAARVTARGPAARGPAAGGKRRRRPEVVPGPLASPAAEQLVEQAAERAREPAPKRAANGRGRRGGGRRRGR